MVTVVETEIWTEEMVTETATATEMEQVDRNGDRKNWSQVDRNKDDRNSDRN